MEARYRRTIPRMALAVVVPTLFLVGGSLPAFAAGYRTTNFTVNAPAPALAKEIGDAAEHFRQQLAIEWIGEEMPQWSKPCPITAQLASGAGGKTSFVFDRGEVFNWQMDIQGSRERMLDSVLPHEITHTIFASYFRCPLPRWADEGACTTMEHRSEVAKQERMLIEFLQTGRGIPFSQMFAMKDYPRDVMPLYSQGHSLAQWMIEAKGKREFVEFLKDGMRDDNWPRAVNSHYGYSDLYAMQNAWLTWVKQGRPDITPAGGATAILASHTAPAVGAGAGGKEVFRGQSPDDDIRPIGMSDKAPPAKLVAVTEPMQPAGDSVYTAMSMRANANREVVKVPPAASHAASVYDASRPGSTMRR